MAEDTLHPTDTPIVVDNRHYSIKQSILHYTPAFLYLLVLFTLIKLTGLDMRSSIIGFGDYAITTMDILTIFAMVITALEMLKVSHAGINNVAETIAMFVMAFVYVLFFLLGAAGVKVLGIFNPRTFANSEFMILMQFAIVEAVVATVVNARTLARSVVDNRS